MNPLARELNEVIRQENRHVFEMLSPLGREFFYPRGILSQGAEAKAKAGRFNATIGIAKEDGHAMALDAIMDSLSGLSPDDSVGYAPATGLPDLRHKWLDKVRAENPSVAGKATSLPVVTHGLTHGLSLVGDLFVAEGDVIVLPDKIWGNYRLLYELRRGARIESYPFFSQEAGFNAPAFARAVADASRNASKVIALMNFPNNPTGYSPTAKEAHAIRDALVRAAEGGTNVIAVTDDAYFGLFYEDAALKESVFGLLAGQHPRMLAIKLDGATKELFVWGLRVGFLTFSAGGVAPESPVFDALEKKLAGAIRSAISNCSRLSQTLVLKALESPALEEQRRQKFETLCARARKVKDVLAQSRFAEVWEPYPFNSGYFMCLKLKAPRAEAVRRHMLDRYGIGLIAIGHSDLRVAFSCLEIDQIEPLFDLLYKGAKEAGTGG